MIESIIAPEHMCICATSFSVGISFSMLGAGSRLRIPSCDITAPLDQSEKFYCFIVFIVSRQPNNFFC